MKILITGCAGFVASSLISFLNQNRSDISILGIDNLSYGKSERLKDLSLDYQCLSVEELTSSSKFTNLSFDAIIHCAAIAPLPDNEADPVKSYEQNVVNTIRIANYSTKIGCKKLIFLSTGALYELSKQFPTQEEIHHATTFVYPTTKMCAEHALNSFSRSYSLNTYSLRLFNMYGPRQDYQRKHPPLIGYLLKSLIRRETAYLFSNGEQRRDYIYIDDLASLVIEILNDSTLINFQTINVGSGITYSVNDIIEIIEEISSQKIDIVRCESSSFWDKYPELFSRKLPLRKDLIIDEVNKYSEADNSLLIKKLSGKKLITMKEGLAKCYDYAIKSIEM